MSKKNNTWKAIQKSKTWWQLDGESVLNTVLEPARPKAGETVTARITHSNVYGPLTDADFFVRIGDPLIPTDQSDVSSHNDWIKASLVEELLWVNDEYVLRSTANGSGAGDPWCGTYEAKLSFHPGKHLVEIKILSRVPNLLRSLVLSDWEIAVK